MSWHSTPKGGKALLSRNDKQRHIAAAGNPQCYQLNVLEGKPNRRLIGRHIRAEYQLPALTVWVSEGDGIIADVACVETAEHEVVLFIGRYAT
ncbi:hypothetical protein CLCR_11078 [Cladophialophora carrionii]|uniref:Uncharacterized protein n=1 Tax=Cladophialophora carrionii TaxID=86049 RepID=A0A1C1CZV2_9EURO|nr:hypothetical protein CLCR_11078 [Cladophialophora carrionii]